MYILSTVKDIRSSGKYIYSELKYICDPALKNRGSGCKTALMWPVCRTKAVNEHPIRFGCLPGSGWRLTFDADERQAAYLFELGCTGSIE